MSQNSPKPPIPHIQKLINECYDAMVEAINDECEEEGSEYAKDASTNVETKDGCIELYMDKYGNYEVFIYHNNDSESECPLLCKAIEDGLPDWRETVEQWEEDNPPYDIWNEHGFRDAADYYKYRYG